MEFLKHVTKHVLKQVLQQGYLNYEKERIETFCYAPNVMPYHVPDKMAYIFNWSGDKERFLPCTGEYQFTTYVTARYKDAQGKMIEEKGPKTTISITLHKKDESTNWGPGLPNTTVETYDLNQIKGKDKTIKVEEPDYTWSIHGKDIANVPEINLSLKITANPDSFPDMGVDDYFGDTLALRMNIEHSGEFGFQAILDYKLGEQYVGKYANLFYVVGDGTFEYMGGSIVRENGVASFIFTHASDYIIAITDVEYTGQKLNETPIDKEEMESESPSSESAKVEEDIEATAEEKKEAPVENESQATKDSQGVQESQEVKEPQGENPSQEEMETQEESTSHEENVSNGEITSGSHGKGILIVFVCIAVVLVVSLGIVFVKKKK